MKSQCGQDWAMPAIGIWLFAAPFRMGGYASSGSIAARPQGLPPAAIA